MSDWDASVTAITQGEATLLSLWGEQGRVHLAVLADDVIRHSVRDCPDGHYPSLSLLHPPALRLERALRDLHGLIPVGLPDPRPWLDHGARPTNYPFLPVNGENLHQVPVGPVHAGIIEPGHFRFTCDGETVARLEQRFGYLHRGMETLMADTAPEQAARFAGRFSGDSTVAYALAFALAAESATGCEPPPRAVWLRALMAEMERLANHLGDVGAVCNDASLPIMLAHCSMLREAVLRTAERCFGHRLMMDRIVPGGTTCDLYDAGVPDIRSLVQQVRRDFPPLVTLYDLTASLQDRVVSTGRLAPELAQQYGAGGFVGRASGRDFDARRMPGYAPYDSLPFAVPVLEAGDVNARVLIRISEIDESLGLIERLLDGLPASETRRDYIAADGEACALVEGFRGDVFVWLRMENGRVARCHARDPSWFQWPLLESAIEGNIIADFPLCNKSFNCSYAGHDL